MGILERFTGTPQDRFAAVARRIARTQPGVTGVDYDPERFALRLHTARAAKPAWVFLHNAFRESRGESTSLRRERIARLVQEP